MTAATRLRWWKWKPPTSRASPLAIGEAELWNASVGVAAYAAHRLEYQKAVLEQYKVYVEMADRVSARRALSNTFFLTLNTAAFVLVGVFWRRPPAGAPILLSVPLAVLLGLCVAWFWVVRSYRQLNTAKYAVVGALEDRLPASPYGRAEWLALGEGNDRAKYWPLTLAEQWVPVLFAVAYVAAFLLALFA